MNIRRINPLFRLKVPTQSFFLLGPRGTGKITWIKDRYPDAVWIDLLLPHEVSFYGANPERLISTAEGAGDNKTIVIDEIQKNPRTTFCCTSSYKKEERF